MSHEDEMLATAAEDELHERYLDDLIRPGAPLTITVVGRLGQRAERYVTPGDPMVPGVWFRYGGNDGWAPLDDIEEIDGVLHLRGDLPA